MSIIVILGCGFIFLLSSFLGLVYSIPAWLAFAVVFMNTRQKAGSSRQIAALAAGMVVAIPIVFLVLFFVTLDFAGLHEGDFSCPRLVEQGGYLWPTVYALTLLTACIVKALRSPTNR